MRMGHGHYLGNRRDGYPAAGASCVRASGRDTMGGSRRHDVKFLVADVAPAPCQSGTDMRLKLSTLSVCLMSALAGPVVAQQGATSGEWRSYSGDLGSTKYSPLDQIDRDNVQDLEIVWRWKTDNFGASVERYSRVTPIMVNGVLYATAGRRRATVAIDAVTGETLWMHRMDEGVRGDYAPRRSSGRGVAYWSGRPDESDAQIFMITPGYHLVALDAATGRPVPNFGQDGVVDLKLGLDRPVDLIEAVIGSSSPPVVVGDVVIVGAALEVGSSPPTKENAPGHVRGYDARTGERLWIFHTIPQPGEFGHETWEGDSWSYTGNVAVWPPFSADAELGYVYLPVEAGTGDYYGGHRPGDNLFSQSLVALDARTGERIWHFQMVHHGIWDYDPASPPILADIVVDGRLIKAVAQVTKQAFTYVFDRVTGEPVWPIEERPVGESDPTVPDQAGAVRSTGCVARRPHRFHARDQGGCDRFARAASDRPDLHSPLFGRGAGRHPGNDPVAWHAGRGQLAGCIVRSGDRGPVRGLCDRTEPSNDGERSRSLQHELHPG
ncbi:MAG TPA: hypothetical protein EYQ27_09715 [Gemmatimonadetes bacterium]|nr:hypothetical protein [Gemmatimonadota bacterium]